MDLIELVLNELSDLTGVNTVSIVENPAIEENFITLSSQVVKFAEVSKEKKILMGAALIPDRPIYRNDNGKEYEVFFSEDTVRKASQLFLKTHRQDSANLEHDKKLEGLTVVESWIVEDTEKDKSSLYGFSYPKGTWVISMKVDNDDVWEDYVKTGKVKGFSIEGMFKPNVKMSADNNEKELIEKIKEILKECN